MVSIMRNRLKGITTFESLINYLEDVLEWPIAGANFETLTFNYEPEDATAFLVNS